LPEIWAFLVLTIPLVLTPGASTAVVLRNSIAGGTRTGLFTALGCNAGNLFYGLLTAFGFAVALRQWPTAWIVLRVLGVAYLAYLGVRSLRRAFNEPAMTMGQGQDGPRDPLHSFTSGFLTNFLNPSLAAFYFIVLPQFIPQHVPFARSALILAAIHVTIALTWHTVLAVTGSTMARLLSAGRPRQALDIVTGLALLALAWKVAV
jgi:threonine/homoserine/homoserine lactone efflux protein